MIRDQPQPKLKPKALIISRIRMEWNVIVIVEIVSTDKKNQFVGLWIELVIRLTRRKSLVIQLVLMPSNFIDYIRHTTYNSNNENRF